MIDQVSTNPGFTGMSSAARVGHVLLVEIANWRKLNDSDQLKAMGLLQESIESDADYQAWQSRESLLFMPTGSGTAIASLEHPKILIYIAMHLGKCFRNTDFELRMAVHSDQLYQIKDLSQRTIVSGPAVNISQNILDVAERNNVLISESTRSLVLAELDTACLTEIGEISLNASRVIKVFNLEGPDFGAPRKALAEILEPPRAQQADLSKGISRRIVLIYKRGSVPDEDVLSMLESRLAAIGHEVFLDRHLRVGMDWALSIRRRIEESDALIPLVSLSAMSSEMMLQEVQIAIGAAKERFGAPIVLPVRVCYKGHLPSELGRLLNPIQHSLWDSAQDNDRVIEELHAALRNLEQQAAVVGGDTGGADNIPSITPESVGGAVPLDSKFYIERDQERPFISAIAQGREMIVLSKAARQMGKTSLLARGIDAARRHGWTVITTDMQKLGGEALESAESVMKALAWSLFDGLDLPKDPDESWPGYGGPSTKFERYMRKVVMPAIPRRLVWALDEIDRIVALPFAEEVFALFRAWFDERQLEPNGPWGRLAIVMAYATEVHLFIKDLKWSPFNVGTRVQLDDFNRQQILLLNEKYGKPLESEEAVSELEEFVGGHPFLVRKTLHCLSSSPGLNIKGYREFAVLDDGPLGDHLRRVLVLLSKDPALTQELTLVLEGKKCLEDSSFYRLRSAGLIAGELSKPRMRCELYQSYLKRHLITT